MKKRCDTQFGGMVERNMGSKPNLKEWEAVPAQDLVDRILENCSKLGHETEPRLRQQIYRSASICLESYYRTYTCVTDNKLSVNDFSRIVECVACGGRATQRPVTENNRVRLGHGICPLQSYPAKSRTELCQTSVYLLEDIAGRNFACAKVSIGKRMLSDSRCCELTADLMHDSTHEYGRDECPTVETFSLGHAGSVVWMPKQNENSSLSSGLPEIVACSSAMQQLLNTVDIIAATSATVLITGETGVGKELIARRLHAAGDRAKQAFVAVNCGAIPEELADSALFGHEEGAFTGAREKHQGYFERANKGTLFLDEINSLPNSTQGRLLRILQQGEYERVGGQRTLLSNARIVVASNVPLEEAVQRGEFRRDLWYRLNIIDLHVPPLRENRENIPHLVGYFLAKLRLKYRKQVNAVSDDVMRQLYDYPWPGNVRELQNTLERSFIFSDDEVLKSIRLNVLETPSPEFTIQAESSQEGWQDYKQRLIKRAEKRFLDSALQRHQGDLDQVAGDMNLSKRSIYLKLCQYGLNPNDYRGL
jgi:DNA-binding NtrC family response regulator